VLLAFGLRRSKYFNVWQGMMWLLTPEYFYVKYTMTSFTPAFQNTEQALQQNLQLNTLLKQTFGLMVFVKVKSKPFRNY